MTTTAAPPVPDAGTVPTERPVQVASGVSVVVVLAVLVVGLVAPQVWDRWGGVAFAVGLLLGLPHGAVDHLVPWWTGTTARRPARTAAVLALYLAAAVTTFLLARTWPTVALVALLVASAVHFGLGETAVRVLRSRRGYGIPRWPAAGLVTVGLPFVAHPDAVRGVLDRLAPGSTAVLLAPSALAVVGGATAVAVVVAVSADLLARDVVPAAELLLLVALFVVVPPLPAFGVFFGAWHGLRHLARLALAVPDDGCGPLASLGRVLVHAAVPTLAVLTALVVLVLVPGLAGPASGALVPVGLAVVLALTVPHMVVVAILDRRQRPVVGRGENGWDDVANPMAERPDPRHL